MKHHKQYQLILALFAILSMSTITRTKYKHVTAATLPTKILMTTMDKTGLETYYNKAGGFTNAIGESLKEALYDVISGHVEYNYDNTDRNIFKIIDRNWDLSPLNQNQLNNYNHFTDMPYIHKLYADYNYSSPDYFKNIGTDRVSFDREHIWAQSLGNFGRVTGAGSDFHALWASDINGNQQGHSNYNFGIPISNITNVYSDKGTYIGRHGRNNNLSGTNRVFEPLDEYKGDIARAMLYMATRYYFFENDQSPKLELTDTSVGSNTATELISGKAGILKTLLDWHELDPVSLFETRRNDLLYYNYQGNRNPFIDHPEWARAAFDPLYVGNGVSSSSEGYVPDPSEELLSVTISNIPSSLQFKESYTGDDLTVTANYKIAGGTDITNSANLELSLPNTANIGEQTITAYYTDPISGVIKHDRVNVFVTNEGVTLGSGNLPATDLFISEYIEGNGNNKALELYNGTGSTIDLSNYTLKLYANGRSIAQGPNQTLSLNGTLLNNKTYTIVHNSAATAFKDVADITNSEVTAYNGDDAIGLYKNDNLIDVIGTIGEQKKWSGIGANGVNGSTENKTLVRSETVISPNTTFNFDDWNVYNIDTSTYLGSHKMNEPAIAITPLEQGTAWAKYFLNVTSSYCEEGEGYNLEGVLWTTLGNEYSFMASDSKVLFKDAIPNGDNTTDISGAKARYIFLAEKYIELYTNNFMIDENNNAIFATQDISQRQTNTSSGLIIIFIFSLITIGGYHVLMKRKKTPS